MAKRGESAMLDVYFSPGGFIVEELAPGTEEMIIEWTQKFKFKRIETLYDLTLLGDQPWFSPVLQFLVDGAEVLFKTISQQSDLELLRDQIQISLEAETAQQILATLPFAVGMEYVDADWLATFWEELLEVFRERVKDYDGTIARYFLDHQAHFDVVGRVFFHLVERDDEEYPFAFLATYSTKPARSKRAVHTPLKNALEEFKGEDEKLLALLRTVIAAQADSPLIKGLMESGELFKPIGFTVEDAYQFLKELPIYEAAGIMCRIPDWWRRKRNSLKIDLKIGEKEPSTVGLNAILDFTPELCIGTDVISANELRKFLTAAQGLIQYKGKWIEVDRARIETVLKVFEDLESQSGQVMTLAEAIQWELQPDRVIPGVESKNITVSNGQWLAKLKDQLVHPDKLPQAELPDTFLASLRPYQETGFRWLLQMNALSLGACLADDMGLGKTIQILALLESLRAQGQGPVLLVLPASLIGNWVSELERFAPSLSYQVLHPSEADGTTIIPNRFLYLTTYQMAARLPHLSEVNWDCLILDEAQAIRNPGTKQTRAIKAIPARQRLALTGTPIENRLSDLWSLFDFLDPGLLGTAKEFDGFARNLKVEPKGYARLRQMIQPFLLRRLKTDRTIIEDLPDKFELNDYTTLSKRQIGLYQTLVKDLERKLSQSEGIGRKGLVLASLMKFKQICNHPDHYLAKDDYKPEQSGKFEMLEEICQTIKEKRERVLVFTQFQEMTGPLSDFLTQVFGRPGLVLHGGTPVKQRKELVKTFNGEDWVPYMVLSLKAGGVGLNLTAANHVVHFDRWWNPAVENQATDRAYRIGQAKNVLVHKFVTRGTIEEKIDELIRRKQQLTQDVLAGGGEAWITEYSNEELLKLFALGGDLQ